MNKEWLSQGRLVCEKFENLLEDDDGACRELCHADGCKKSLIEIVVQHQAEYVTQREMQLVDL